MLAEVIDAAGLNGTGTYYYGLCFFQPQNYEIIFDFKTPLSIFIFLFHPTVQMPESK